MTGNSPPPGWYTDGQGGQRWWDGSKWYEAQPVVDETLVEKAPSADTPARVHGRDPSAGPTQGSSNTLRSLTGMHGLAVAIAGVLVSAVAIVLLIAVNPDCLNNVACGELKESFLSLFGIKLGVLAVGLVMIGVGFLLHRGARKSVQSVRTSEKSTSASFERTITALRRKRVWIPLAAFACLALAAGTWAVATAGPSDEEVRAQEAGSAADLPAESVTLTLAFVESAPFGDLYIQGAEGPEGCMLSNTAQGASITIEDADGTIIGTVDVPPTAKSDWTAENCTITVTADVPGDTDFYTLTLNSGTDSVSLTVPAENPVATFTS